MIIVVVGLLLASVLIAAAWRATWLVAERVRRRAGNELAVGLELDTEMVNPVGIEDLNVYANFTTRHATPAPFLNGGSSSPRTNLRGISPNPAN